MAEGKNGILDNIVGFFRRKDAALSPKEKSQKIFYAVLNNFTRNKVESGKVQTFLKDVDSKTGLSNQILMSRATQDLNNLGGKLIVEFINGGPQEDFAVHALMALATQSKGLEEEKQHPKLISAILLNPNARPVRESDPHNIQLTEEEIFGVARAIVSAQAELETQENNGGLENFMTRTEYRQIFSGLKNS